MFEFENVEEVFEVIKSIVTGKDAWYYLYLTNEGDLELWYRKGNETDLEFNECDVTTEEFEELGGLMFENDIPVTLFKELVI